MFTNTTELKITSGLCLYDISDHMPTLCIKNILQHSLMNWERASKRHLYKIKVLRNRFLRASLFRLSDCAIIALYAIFGVLKFML